ncbi:MAG: hypothetical protein IID42_13885, partial [Planctomycetes bacterium]|nr:hypothetical protein [Planctomycetota bacterium]
GRISKIICDRCGEEAEFKDRYPQGWGLLDAYLPADGGVETSKKGYELCPDCVFRAVEKPS